MERIKIYLDSGASLPKDLHKICECYQFPYDSAHRPKNNTPILALPCELTWGEAHCRWEEAKFTWQESASSVPDRIKDLIGKSNQQDYKHLGSALKMGCRVFLTSDKTHLWAKRNEIEAEYGLRIFHMPSEEKELRAFVTQFLSES